MANTYIERIEFGYERWSKGQDPATAEPPAEDFEFRPPPELPGKDLYRGRAAVREFAVDLADGFEFLRIEPLSYEESGGDVIARVHLTAKGRSSGIDVEREEFHLWKFRNDEVIAISCFTSREDAVAASERFA